jgi:D-arabinose 1-dehydrogenase-like Zn-dependent alcohol dehydrogenase
MLIQHRLKTIRIEDRLGSLCPPALIKEPLNCGVANRGPFSAPMFPESLPRNDDFVGMTSIMCSIYRLVSPLGSHRRVVISGAGGVGYMTFGFQKSSR